MIFYLTQKFPDFGLALTGVRPEPREWLLMGTLFCAQAAACKSAYIPRVEQIQTKSDFVALQQLVTVAIRKLGRFSVVNLGIRIRRFQLVAGGQHGEAANHAVHVEAVRAAGARFFTRLG